MSDLISRQAAIEAAIWAADEYGEWVREALEKVPSVERSKGKWMFESETEMFQCSKCKGMAVRNNYPFCHWCGAEMESEE